MHSQRQDNPLLWLIFAMFSHKLWKCVARKHGSAWPGRKCVAAIAPAAIFPWSYQSRATEQESHSVIPRVLREVQVESVRILAGPLGIGWNLQEVEWNPSRVLPDVVLGH